MSRMIEWQMENLGRWTDPETEARRSASVFKSTWENTLALLSDEIRTLGGTRAVISVVLVDGFVRRDGMLASRSRVGHPGAVVSFATPDLGPLRYASDAYESRWTGDRHESWQANVRAIALGLEALRAVDRYGIAMRREQYVGYRALPPGRGDASSGMTTTDAAAILCRAAGMPEPAVRVMDREAFATYGPEILRKARAAAHPDRHGGDRGQWNLVDNAAQELRRAGWLAQQELAS